MKNKRSRASTTNGLVSHRCAHLNMPVTPKGTLRLTLSCLQMTGAFWRIKNAWIRCTSRLYTPTTTVVETPENCRMNEAISRFTRFSVLSLSPDDMLHISASTSFSTLVNCFFRLCDSVISLTHSCRVCLVFNVHPVLRSTINFDVIVVWIYAESYFSSSVARPRGKSIHVSYSGEFVYSPNENKLNEPTRN